jgi:acetyl esterase/lipase
MLLRTTPSAVSLLYLAFALTALGEPEIHTPPTSDPTFPELPASIPLWRDGAPGSEGKTSPWQGRWENYETTWYPAITNINNPAIIPFLPAPGTATGIGIVVCPGGGHKSLAMEHEGYAVGVWLANHGIAAFVLEYRLANAPGSTYKVNVHALMDAQRAIRTVRSRAKEWNVDPNRLGIMGFSAGGELAALAATQFDHPVKGSSDSVDALDCRPDFQALLYPGLPSTPLEVNSKTPPAFLCGASDDQFHLTPAMVRYYQRLSDAGIPAELHVYAQGGHGFGIRDQDKAVYSWMGLFRTWVGTLRVPSGV